MVTVRFALADIDEFIEKHAQDVGSSGIFIHTNEPFPPGTLIKFAVHIHRGELVLKGIGRVGWRRMPAQSSDELPSGMGIRFISVDENTKPMLERMLANQREQNAFDVGAQTLDD